MLFLGSAIFRHRPCGATPAVTTAPFPSPRPSLPLFTVPKAPETGSCSEAGTVTECKTWSASMDSDKVTLGQVNQLSQAVSLAVGNPAFSLGVTCMSSGKGAIRTDCLDCCTSRLLYFSLMLDYYAVLFKKTKPSARIFSFN